ncbi:MAG TPA: hypothetical protein VGS60_16990 [Actinomycetes bacterium]|jgi:hypothetical protein|nr:hypothetical protein [Actinomycetes bacterium]
MPDPYDWNDLFPEQTSDDADESCGESLTSDDVERILAEKPPHHLD